MWLNELKIAVIEQDIEKLHILLENIEIPENIEDLQEALYLFREASEHLYTLKDELQLSMIKLQKHREFLSSSSQTKTTHLNITT